MNMELDELIKQIKAEAEKIPSICGAGKCLFEIDYIYSEAGQKYLEMRRSKCPHICPKYGDKNDLADF